MCIKLRHTFLKDLQTALQLFKRFSISRFQHFFNSKGKTCSSITCVNSLQPGSYFCTSTQNLLYIRVLAPTPSKTKPKPKPKKQQTQTGSLGYLLGKSGYCRTSQGIQSICGTPYEKHRRKQPNNNLCMASQCHEFFSIFLHFQMFQFPISIQN